MRAQATPARCAQPEVLKTLRRSAVAEEPASRASLEEEGADACQEGAAGASTCPPSSEAKPEEAEVEVKNEVKKVQRPAPKRLQPGALVGAVLTAVSVVVAAFSAIVQLVTPAHLPPIHLHFQHTARDHLPADISRDQVLEFIRSKSSYPERWQILDERTLGSDAQEVAGPIVYATTSTSTRWEETLFVERQFRLLQKRVRALLLIRVAPPEQCADREERDGVEEFISDSWLRLDFGSKFSSAVCPTL